MWLWYAISGLYVGAISACLASNGVTVNGFILAWPETLCMQWIHISHYADCAHLHTHGWCFYLQRIRNSDTENESAKSVQEKASELLHILRVSHSLSVCPWCIIQYDVLHYLSPMLGTTRYFWLWRPSVYFIWVWPPSGGRCARKRCGLNATI